MLLGKNGQLGQEIEKQANKTGINLLAFGHGEVDITDEKKLDQLLKDVNPSIVINTTAFHVVPKCEILPQEAFAINCYAVTQLSEMTAKKNIAFVTISTDYVFDGKKGEPYVEDDLPNPVQMYGLSKYAGEIGTLNYNPESYVVRTCGVYGGKEGSRSKKGNFVLNILEAAKTKKEIEVANDQIVNPTYAVDLAHGLLTLLEKQAEPGIYHLANSGCCSWADFAAEVIKLANLPAKIKGVQKGEITGGVRRPMFSALDSAKIKKYQIKIPSWQDALGRYIKFLDL